MSSRLHRPRWPRILVSVSLAILCVALWRLEAHFLAPTGWHRPLGQLAPGEYEVERVVDGDTIILKHNRLRVRLQGIDTPETVKANTEVQPWGREATAYVEQFLQACDWQVRIEIDGEPVDRYGRHLAFVWHEDRLLNELLVRQGLARAKTTFDFSQAKKQLLRQAQESAESAGLGLWSDGS